MASNPLRDQAYKHIHGKLLAGELPAGITELNALRNGLRALSAQWHSRRKPR